MSDGEIIRRGDLPKAASITVDVCDDCNAIHLDLWKRDGKPFATAALPPENWAPFLADLTAKMQSRTTVAQTSVIDANDPLVEVIRTAISQHSSPTIGREGSTHGGQRGWIVYENRRSTLHHRGDPAVP